MQKGITPGSSKSLWKAVNVAKDINLNDLPAKMYEDGNIIEQEELQYGFADFFERKIINLTGQAIINNYVYNGINKLTLIKTNFMTHENILKTEKLIKMKNSEGHNMIPKE